MGELAADVLAVRITWQVTETKPSCHYLGFSSCIPPKSSPSVSQKVKHMTTYDAVKPLHILKRNENIHLLKDSRTEMFTGRFVGKAKSWELFIIVDECPSTNDQTDIMWSIHTMGKYSQ